MRMMIAFGRFLELSLPAPDVLESLDFYRRLGFTEFPTGDIRRWHYAVVSDGTVTIGLHASGFEEATLSFVRPEVAMQVRALEAQGQEFEWRRLGTDDFNEAALRTVDGQLIRMMEARTFSPAGVPAASLLGTTCSEVTLHCDAPERTRAWLESLGFVAEPDPPSAGTVHVASPGLRLGLRVGPRTDAASLRFRPADPGAVAAALAARDLQPVRGRAGYEIKAPEGTRLIVES